MALHKTESIVITKRRNRNQLGIKIDEKQLRAGQEDLNYLGIQFNTKLSFTAHEKLIAAKTNKAVQNLSRILPNISTTVQAKKNLTIQRSTFNALIRSIRVDRKDEQERSGQARKSPEAHRLKGPLLPIELHSWTQSK